MKEFFKGKVICITGSGQGIGKTMAFTFGEMGARVCINGRSEHKIKKVEEELRSKGIECIAIAADVSVPSESEKLIKGCVDRFGSLDVLINNAGIASRGKIDETTPEAWEQTMHINFNGVVNCSYYALPHILKSKGSIVIISSMAAKVGLPGHSAYSASKMALTAYARAMQNEYSKKDLHCGLIFVGFTENENQKEILGPDGAYKTIPKRGGLKLSSRESVANSVARLIYNRTNQKTLTLMGKAQHILLKLAPGFVYFLLRKNHRDYDSTYN
ncbi:MAG: SDR family NAD(P)-dependent oxidoreductase [Bacteroidetes bacterium]|nr:SDR family NAD(P)-dependent oxidoreductase [Bacteroidota bacterium]